MICRAEGSTSLNPRLTDLNRNFYHFLLIVALFTLGNSSDAFIILRAQERGLSVLQIMGMLLSFTAVYTILSGPTGALSDHFGRLPIVLGGRLNYSLELGAVFELHLPFSSERSSPEFQAFCS